MPRRFVSQYGPGERVEDEVFLIRSKDLRTTTNGGLYIHAVLVDRTGQVVARAWQATEALFEGMPEGGFMRFRGRMENYKGNLQFIIDGMKPAEPGSFELADFMPTTKNDVDKMWNRMREILRGIKNPDLRTLVEEFLSDNDLMARFRKAPAATVMHHAYIGGLLEHTLNLLEVALKIIPFYPRISLDLVLAGLFLHDIGKARELQFETSFTYSDDGQLLGHIVQATLWIDKKIDAIVDRSKKPFPDRLRWVIQHIILSHHGQYEFGSPKLPAIPEAIVIHHLDNLDAKANTYLNEIENDRDPAATWTNYIPSLGTKIYKPDVMGVRPSTPARMPS